MRKGYLILWGIGFNAFSFSIGYLGYFLLTEMLFKAAGWMGFFKYTWT